MVWLTAIFGGAWVFWCLLQLVLAGYAASVFNRQLLKHPAKIESQSKEQAAIEGRAASSFGGAWK